MTPSIPLFDFPDHELEALLASSWGMKIYFEALRELRRREAPYIKSHYNAAKYLCTCHLEQVMKFAAAAVPTSYDRHIVYTCGQKAAYYHANSIGWASR